MSRIRLDRVGSASGLARNLQLWALQSKAKTPDDPVNDLNGSRLDRLWRT
jgi:hypothetical protein